MGGIEILKSSECIGGGGMRVSIDNTSSMREYVNGGINAGVNALRCYIVYTTEINGL